MIIQVPKDVSFIIDTFYNNGYEAFIVGGCIRDNLLNKNPIDYDIATSASPEVTQSLFPKSIPTGIKHGTITILINNTPYEVTTYRTDGAYLNNRKPDSVTFVTNIKDDLSRRDFTINAFAYNSKKGLIDYHNGLKDLNNKVIRTVGLASNRFNEDALRMLRAIRFSSQLGFSIEESTYNAIYNNSNLIKNISSERINSEFCKILLSDYASIGLTNLSSTKLLSYILPEVSNKLYLGKSISIINKLPKNIHIRLAAMLIKVDLYYIPNLLKKLKFDKVTSNKILLLLNNYSRLCLCKSRIDIKKLIISVGKDLTSDLITLFEVYESLPLDKLRVAILTIIYNNEPLYIKDLNINGTILKENFHLYSGKIIGEILNHLLQLVINEDIPNQDSILIKESENYIKRLNIN